MASFWHNFGIILASLRHFVQQAGVDGFRFDLGPALGRMDHGFDPRAPLLEEMRADPVLADRIMIAEPWDIGPGGYQLGQFPGGWLEWNDRYRDDMRRFWRGDAGMIGAVATRLAGSSDIFPNGRSRTVNFLAAHDGFTLADIIAELDAVVQVPGLTNAWLPPIKTRIDMLSTGIRTPVGIRVSGPDLDVLSEVATQLEQKVKALPGSRSVFAERAESGLYLNITPNMAQLARYGITLTELQQYVANAIGGAPVAQSIQGRERFDISLRFPRELRSHPDDIAKLPLQSRDGAFVLLEQVADISVDNGPVMIRAENARLTSWVFIDLQTDTQLGRYLNDLQQLLATQQFPPQVTVSIGGQYEYLQRVSARLQQLVPVTLLLIVVLLYLTFRRFSDVVLVLVSLPFALSGSLWLLYLLDYQLSVAVAVGLIALSGVAAEFAVVMLLYLKRAVEELQPANHEQLWQAIMHGAVQRVRPKAMTVLTIIVSLLPIMLGAGAGNEVMQRIAAPMLGGMVAAPLVSMLLMPVLYFLLLRRRLPA
ncbi:efflux RND transporter permease subunit [Rheinheimera sp.]|uniref:efflux RND transporter permease subunit n=1 Tax=Rheinheimera sp. TaxID=1869214 RepID=UPI002352A4E6|nr:efflux RND transporter permease subunit [Rheinheimera sp.]